jgi:hypothetical protein
LGTALGVASRCTSFFNIIPLLSGILRKKTATLHQCDASVADIFSIGYYLKQEKKYKLLDNFLESIYLFKSLKDISRPGRI